MLTVIEGASQLERLNAEGGMAVHLSALSRGPMHLAFEGSQSDSFSIWSTKSLYGFHSTPKIPFDVYTIRFVGNGQLARRHRNGDDIIVGYDRASITGFQAMRDERASAGFSSISTSISAASIVKACRALDGQSSERLPNFQPVVDVDTVGLLALRHTVEVLMTRMLDGIDQHDLVTPLFEELLIYQLVSAWPTIDGAFAANVPDETSRSLRLAVDYIEANLSQRIRLADIAAVAGVGVRTLQLAFRRRLDCSPMQYLIARRLDQVHAALEAAEGMTVRDIALQWGFTHMSDFGRRYRKRFGILPSDMTRRH